MSAEKEADVGIRQRDGKWYLFVTGSPEIECGSFSKAVAALLRIADEMDDTNPDVSVN